MRLSNCLLVSVVLAVRSDEEYDAARAYSRNVRPAGAQSTRGYNRHAQPKLDVAALNTFMRDTQSTLDQITAKLDVLLAKEIRPISEDDDSEDFFPRMTHATARKPTQETRKDFLWPGGDFMKNPNEGFKYPYERSQPIMIPRPFDPFDDSFRHSRDSFSGMNVNTTGTDQFEMFRMSP